MILPELDVILKYFQIKLAFLVGESFDKAPARPKAPVWLARRLTFRWLSLGVSRVVVWLRSVTRGPVVRRIGVHNYQCRHLLTGGLQLDSYFVSNDATKGPAKQIIRTAFLYGPNLLDVIGCHIPERAGKLTCTIESACLQAVEWVLVRNISDQRHVTPAYPSRRMYAEQGWFAALWPNGKENAKSGSHGR